jgi:hypothetical protein
MCDALLKALVASAITIEWNRIHSHFSKETKELQGNSPFTAPIVFTEDTPYESNPHCHTLSKNKLVSAD